MVPPTRQDFLEKRAIRRSLKVPALGEITAAMGCSIWPVFTRAGSSSRAGSGIGKRRPGFRLGKWYIQRAMGGPRFHEILAKWRPISQRRKSPYFRVLRTVKDSLFLTPFPHFFYVGEEMGQSEQSLSAIRVCEMGPPNGDGWPERPEYHGKSMVNLSVARTTLFSGPYARLGVPYF